MIRAFVVLVASLCHEANRAYCQSIGDTSLVPWDEAPDWQKKSAIKGAELALTQDVTAEQLHESWMAQKVQDGWVYGETKDVEKKTHPCMVPYAELPAEQRVKDAIFRSVVAAAKAQLEVRDAEQAHKIADLEMALESASVEAVKANGDELERFLRKHDNTRLSITITPRTNLVRISTLDQTDAIEGAVHGNVFQPKR